MFIEPNVPYDGRFTFARIRYTVYGRSGWEFDYPTMERNLMSMMNEVTSLRPHVTGSNIHTLDDPELLKYPIAYISEPGYWHMTDAEVAGLRRYLAKGGFLIVDDFMRNEWYNFEREILRALPAARIQKLDVSHPIFHSFFDIQTLEMGYPHEQSLRASFLGIYTARGILPVDPFVSIDQQGVGELVKIGVERGRKVRPKLKVGICGEHGGDPASVAFCHEAKLDYVSCSPFRVQTARIAAGRAALGAG